MVARRIHMMCAAYVQIVASRWRVSDGSWLHSGNGVKLRLHSEDLVEVPSETQVVG